ncbi:hypothetical protein [Mycobacteroides franklinii]|uniref:hypothetical protein n=1 Tax=Mycobacteroides franklinii TaxID=948102 RepID=UPI0012FFC741|nr:hypothetical protein [Mycobacteroides franklinii]
MPKPIVSPETSTLDSQSPAAGDDMKALTAGEKTETALRLTIDVPAPSSKPSASSMPTTSSASQESSSAKHTEKAAA